MRKKWGFLAVAITAIFLVTGMGGAFAAPGYINNGGGPVPAVAVELLPPSTNLTIPNGTFTAANGYGLGLTFKAPDGFVWQVDDFITFTFSNVKVASTPMVICGDVGGVSTIVGNLTSAIDTVNGSSTAIFRITDAINLVAQPIDAAAVLTVATTCTPVPPATGLITVVFRDAAKGSAATVSTVATASGGQPLSGATLSSGPLFNFVQQFASTPAPTLVVDPLDFASQLTLFAANGNYAGALQSFDAANTLALLDNAGVVTLAAPNIFVTPTAGDTYAITVTGPRTGVTAICWYDTNDVLPPAQGTPLAGCTNASQQFAAVDSNTVRYNVAGNRLVPPPGGTYNGRVLFVFNGTSLSPRIFQVSSKMNFAADPILPKISSEDLLATQDYFQLKLLATQYVIPYIKVAQTSGTDTFIKLQSKNTVPGTNGVTAQITATDATALTCPVAPTTWTITPGTPFVIKGSDLVACATAQQKSVDAVNGFNALITINASEDDVTGYANYTDNTGSFKRIPVKTVGGKNVE